VVTVSALVRCHRDGEKNVIDLHIIPGNEPDPSDMSTEPGTEGLNSPPAPLDIPDEANISGEVA
jgi:hypothetical protein